MEGGNGNGGSRQRLSPMRVFKHNATARCFFHATRRVLANCVRTGTLPRGGIPQAKIEGMKRIAFKKQQSAGKVGWVVLWLLGVPIPVLLILFLLRGCT
jgi:hypothetical protein